MEESWRALSYPKAEWYTGFSIDKANGSPDRAKYEAIEKDAQNKLSQSITVHIQGTTAIENTSRMEQSGKNVSETINRNFKQEITTASNAVLAKMETYSHFDKKSGYIYGFAAVKKKDLADFYKSNINSLFIFADKEFALVEQQAGQGRKKRHWIKSRL